MATVLITGGARGIGRAAALLAADRGWSVGVNYASDEGAAVRTVEGINARGQRGQILPGDVSDEAQVIAMFDQFEETLGAAAAVVVNAGIVGHSMTLAEMDAERISRILAVNTFGAILCAREAIRRMSHSRGGAGGSIVFVSSRASTLGSPFEYVDYAASKGAIDTLTIGLAKEVGAEGIRVNAVRPGIIETEIHASGGRPDRAHDLGGQTPLRRCGTAEEVAAAILWLLGPESSYCSGSILDVAGGR